MTVLEKYTKTFDSDETCLSWMLLTRAVIEANNFSSSPCSSYRIKTLQNKKRHCKDFNQACRRKC